MSEITRRAFLGASAGVMLTASTVQAQDQKPNVPGFEQTKTTTEPGVWKPWTDRKVKVGLVGYGFCKFSAQFSFQNHPNVEIVAVSDLFPDRCAALAKVVKCKKTYPSLEEMVKDDSIEAIFCATDAPSHAKHCIEVLNHGKHVCTAVPVFYGNIEYAEKLLEVVKKNKGLIYAMFETSVFHSDLYAMEKIYAAGGFGRIIYSEGEYCHTKEPGAPAYPSYGDWRKNGCPIWYPTHATAYYIGVTHKHYTEVSCQGILPFDEKNRIPNGSGNVFRGEVGLFRTSEGGTSRIIVCNAYGKYLEAGRVRGEIGGYDGTYAPLENAYTGNEDGKRIVKMLGDKTAKYPLPPGVAPGGHGGSHGYLCDNFINAILKGTQPAVNVIDALNMTVPGYYAHLSALKDGENIKLPVYQL